MHITKDGFMRVRDKIYTHDPYDNFPADQIFVDKQGWGYRDPIFNIVIRELRPKLTLEVGSWKGMSALTMGRAIRSECVDGEIVCIDTWLGSPEHVLGNNPEWYDSLRYLNGFPRLYNTFLSNVIDEGLTDIITPFPATSTNAAYILKKWDVLADLCYLDAAHEYDEIARDISVFFPLVRQGGVLLMDDYMIWEGVTRAVDEFIEKGNLGGSSLRWRGKAIIAVSDCAVFHKIRSEVSKYAVDFVAE